MLIKSIEAKPYEKSIFPSISFEIEIIHTKYLEAIIGVNGWVETDDGKIIANFNEDVLEKTKVNEIGAKVSHYDSEFKDEIYKTLIIASLHRKALTYIEKRRMDNRKRDVKLILHLNVRYMQNKAVIFHSDKIKSEDIGLKPINVRKYNGTYTQAELIVSYYDPKFFTSMTNQWILSGDGRNVFLALAEQTLIGEKTISSSDWINDYAPKLELGEFFIVEIPKGEKIIEKAWNYVEKAEESYRRWDTKGVYANCREVGVLLDGIMKEKFGKDNFVYEERWGRTYGRFKNISFNEFASLDLHLEDIKKKYSAQDIKISKADAEHILIVTKALIKYAEELLKEVNK